MVYLKNHHINNTTTSSYWWRSCQSDESLRDEVWVVDVEDKADHTDEPLSDVVVAVGEAVREVEEVAHPHGDLEFRLLETLQEFRKGEPQQQSWLTIAGVEETLRVVM